MLPPSSLSQHSVVHGVTKPRKLRTESVTLYFSVHCLLFILYFEI